MSKNVVMGRSTVRTLVFWYLIGGHFFFFWFCSVRVLSKPKVSVKAYYIIALCNDALWNEGWWLSWFSFPWEKSGTVVGRVWCKQSSTWEKAGAGATDESREMACRMYATSSFLQEIMDICGREECYFFWILKKMMNRKLEDLRLFGSQ